MKNHMRYVIILILGLVANIVSAQQVNPVPDYTFANRMSAGRNTVTDTAAYFSIGPRYGAIRGMMPPMVVDTASVSGNKRNGLLIFSVQKNKFVYWDSVGSKWAEMAGTGGTAINSGDTASMLLPYLRKADTTAMLAPYLKESDTVFLSNRINLKVNISDTSSMLTNYVRHAGYGLTKSGQAFLVDTAAMATRARVQKGIDSVAVAGITGSGTTNYVAKFTGTKALGNSLIQDNGLNVGVNTTPTTTKFTVSESANSWAAAFIAPSSNEVQISGNITGNNNGPSIRGVTSGGAAYTSLTLDASYLDFKISGVSQQRIFSNGNIGIGTTTDAGYKTDISGTLRSTFGANFATTSGSVGIGTTTSTYKLNVAGSIGIIGDANFISNNITGVSQNQFVYRNNGVNKWQIYLNTTNDSYNIFSSTNTVERLTLLESGNLGIGTTSPSYKLDVTGDIRSTTSAYFATTSGNVGVGTASATSPLTVFNPTANTNILEVRGGGGSSQSRIILNYGTQTSVTAENALIFSNTSEFSLRARANRVINFYTDAGSGESEKLRITSDGELLIGTTTDAGDYKLQVNGNERIAGKLDVITTTEYAVNIGRSGTSATTFQAYNSTAAMAVGIESSTGGGLFSGTSAYAAVFGNANNYPTQFITNNTVKATITASGNLLIGTTTDNGLGYKLQVNGGIYANSTIQAKAAQVSIDSVNNLAALYISQHTITGSSTQPMMQSDVTLNTTGDVNLVNYTITNTASGANTNWLRFTDGSNTFRVTKSAEVVTAAPTGGSIRKWKLGEAATVSPTSPNRTIRVEIDGTVYYLHAKTTND